MTTPYSDLPPERYWRTGVAEAHASSVSNLYRKKFAVTLQDRITTAGSCFAQHVARHMKRRGYGVTDAEPALIDMPAEIAQRYGYQIYSARYGNVYSARQLLQLVQDADAGAFRAEDVWTKGDRFYDALRPGVEPNGLGGVAEVKAHRLRHLACVKELFGQTDVLVFTLGLTEAWEHRRSGTIYPTCPGVIAGAFDDQTYGFKNFDFLEVYEDMKAVRRILSQRNPKFRMILTVSPVPLTATASGDHILAATTYSKSVLRAVCGSLAREFADVDYFPSYEIIASPMSRGFFYEQNLRSVTELGVETVMKTFFAEHADVASAELAPGRERKGEGKAGKKMGRKRHMGDPGRRAKADAVCEEVLLEAFAKR